MIIGHQKQLQFLKKSAELNKLAHAYLFSGQEKLGKKTLAIEFINWLFNEDIQKRQHPDFIFITPINKEIQISQIRDLSWKISLKPSLAPFKAAIIDQAHQMNPEAQNCFLKTLEEPKGKTLLILISEHPEMLFPTILSRLQKIKFYPVKKVEIENYLKQKGRGEKESEEVVEICLGSPGEAINFSSNPEKLEIRKQKIKEIISLAHSDLVFRFQYVKNLSKEPNLREILNIWLNYFRNILLARLSFSKENFGELKEIEIKEDFNFRGYNVTKLKNIIQKIQNTNFLISTTNVNQRLALENLMLEL